MEINLAVVVVAIVAVEEDLEVAWIEVVGVEAAVGGPRRGQGGQRKAQAPNVEDELEFPSLGK